MLVKDATTSHMRG